MAGRDGEGAAVADADLGAGEEGCAEDEAAAAGLHLIESEGGEDVPCRHLSDVLVAAEAVGCGVVELSHDVAQLGCGLPWLSGVVVEVDDMVAGLVAVGILSDESADVGRRLGAQVALDGEELVELAEEGLLAAEEADESVRVVGHEPRVLPGVALGVVVGAVDHLDGVELGPELSVAAQCAHELQLGVEVAAIRLAALEEQLVVGALAQQPRHAGHAVVVETVFEGLGDGLVRGFLVVGDVAILLEQAQRADVLQLRLLHRAEGLLGIPYKALKHHVGQHGHGRRAHHAVGLGAPEVPDGQASLLLKDLDERLGPVGLHLGCDEGHEGVVGAVGVP